MIVMTDVIMPGTWMSPSREILIRAREQMGLGPQKFAERLNDVIGPQEWPRRPLSWHAIRVWETTMRPPEYVVEASLELLRHWGAGLQVDVVDLDEVVVAA